MESFANTFGAMLIAYMFDAVLYGMAMLMLFQYFKNFRRSDGLNIKLFVALLGVLATVQFTNFSGWAYHDLVTLFGTPDLLDLIPVTCLVQLTAIYVVGFCAQMYFVSRVWLLTENKILYTVPIAVFACLQVVAGIVLVVQIAINGTFHNLVNLKLTSSIQSGAMGVADILITGILCFILQNHRSGFAATDSILDKLTGIAIARGAVTSVAAVLHFSLYLWRPDALFFLIAHVPTTQLYVMSVVATLNSRESLRSNHESSLNRSLELANNNVQLAIMNHPNPKSSSHNTDSIRASLARPVHSELRNFADPSTNIRIEEPYGKKFRSPLGEVDY